MAALTVQGGLVKNKMKGGVYNKPPYSRPPPLTCFFLFERHYLQIKSYLEVLFSIPGVPIENKTVKGGGLL